MGNQIALAVANVKPPVIVEVLTVKNSGNLKIGLVIPTDIFIAFTLTVLFFVQNAKQLIPKSKAQIGKAVIELLIIKGRVFRKADRECQAVWLFLGKCFCFLLLGNDYFQVVVCRIFL